MFVNCCEFGFWCCFCEEIVDVCFCCDCCGCQLVVVCYYYGFDVYFVQFCEVFFDVVFYDVFQFDYVEYVCCFVLQVGDDEWCVVVVCDVVYCVVYFFGEVVIVGFDVVVDCVGCVFVDFVIGQVDVVYLCLCGKVEECCVQLCYVVLVDVEVFFCEYDDVVFFWCFVGE